MTELQKLVKDFIDRSAVYDDMDEVRRAASLSDDSGWWGDLYCEDAKKLAAILLSILEPDK